MKRTKMVCTIGPACDSPAKLKSMMRGGMNAARFNLSHGTYASHKTLIRRVRQAAKELEIFIPIIADLQGPKIRLGELPREGVSLVAHETVVFSTGITKYNGREIPLTYANLHKDVKVGHRFLIDDGLLELKIIKISGRQIFASVVTGGSVTSHKGMNFPDSHLSVGALTKKDKEDVLFAVEQEAEWIALSFVKSEEDVRELRQLIARALKPGQLIPKVIVKIEKHEAIDGFEAILHETDAVMIARGDLGVEIPAQEVPVRQKEMINKCRQAGKPVIVATQMLDSMIRNPRPTRAEVSDVANAVFDHTDGVMLSGESANGKYPVQAVKMMAKIIEEAECSPFDDVPTDANSRKDPVATVASSIKEAAFQQVIDGTIVSLDLASWGQTVHRDHPEIPLFLACTTMSQARQSALRWGIIPFILKNAHEQTFAAKAVAWLQKKRFVKKGMRLAVVLGGRHGEAFDVVKVE